MKHNKHFITVFFVLTFSIVFLTNRSRSQSILLAEFQAGGSSSTSSASYLDVASVSFELGFEAPASGEEICELPRVGCEVIPIGNIYSGAVFVFDGSNSMYFEDVVTGLTNDTDQLLWFILSFYNSSNTKLHCVGTANYESYELNRSPDLAGYQIDFIRLKVNNFTLSEKSCCGGGGLEFAVNITWEIYGPGKTPHELTESLIKEVQILVDMGILNLGQGNAFISKLDLALLKIDNGNFRVARNILIAFINQVNSYITEGILTEEEGQELILAAEDIIEQINNSLPKQVNNDFSNEIPVQFTLEQNYPNPFNPSTKIKYSVPQTSQVQIKVFDVLGNEIETLINEEKPSGTYEINWYAENLQSGIYFYRLQAGKFVQTKKMVLTK